MSFTRTHTFVRLGPKMLEALKFIAVHPRCRAAEVAEALWPKSRMHTMTSNQGNGATMGKCAWLSGGSITGKLVKIGLVERCFVDGHSSCAVKYRITSYGELQIEWQDEHPYPPGSLGKCGKRVEKRMKALD